MRVTVNLEYRIEEKRERGKGFRERKSFGVFLGRRGRGSGGEG